MQEVTIDQTKRNKARVGISYGRKEFVGKQLDLLLNAVVEAGYTECEIVVGGFVQRHNYLRNLTAKGKQLSSDYPKEFAGKTIADLTSKQIEALIQTPAFKKEAEDYGIMCEKTWYEKHTRQIEDFRAKGINVTVTFWEKALESDEVKKLHKLIDDIGKEREEKSAGLLRGEIESAENEEVKRLNQAKKEFYNTLLVAIDQVWAVQVGEEEKAPNYRSALLCHKNFFIKKIEEMIRELLGVLASPNSDLIYPMERHPAGRMICKTLERLAVIAGIEMRVLSTPFWSNNSKAKFQRVQKDIRSNSESEAQQKPFVLGDTRKHDSIDQDASSLNSTNDVYQESRLKASVKAAEKRGFYTSSTTLNSGNEGKILDKLEAKVQAAKFFITIADIALQMAKENTTTTHIAIDLANEMFDRLTAYTAKSPSVVPK